MRQRESTNDREQWLINQLNDTPWASAENLAWFGPYTVSQVRKSLTAMEHNGLVRGTKMGATRPKQNRYVLTENGVSHFREGVKEEPSWYNCQLGVRDLAARLPMVEQAYSVLPKLLGPDRHLLLDGLREGYIPRLVRFTWLRSGSLHAIVEFEEGLWFVLVWVGQWSSVKALRDKWNDRLGELDQYRCDSMSGSYVDRDANPSAWVIVAQDLWAAQMGIEEVAPDESCDRKLVFVDGRDLSRTRVLVPSEDRVTEITYPREIGKPERTVERLEQLASMAAANGKGRHSVFNVVSEYHGCTAAQIRRYLGDSIDDEVGAVLQELVDAGLVVRFGRNYFLAPDGSARAARIDRRPVDDVKKSLKNFVKEEDGTRNRYGTHDGRVMEIAIRLMRNGFPCANGWRTNIHVDGMKTVKPDLAVLVGDGPFGHNWYYLEYERSADTAKAIENKLRTYHDFANKGVDLPFIVVCDTEKAEELFLEKGKYLNVITAVYADVMTGLLTGDATVFRRREGPVSLYAPVDPRELLLWPEIRPRHAFVGRWAPDRKKTSIRRWTKKA